MLLCYIHYTSYWIVPCIFKSWFTSIHSFLTRFVKVLSVGNIGSIKWYKCKIKVKLIAIPSVIYGKLIIPPIWSLLV